MHSVKKESFYQRRIEQIRDSQRGNDYIVAKGDAETMSRLKFWRQIEYYTIFEQILLENERLEAQKQKQSTKKIKK